MSFTGRVTDYSKVEAGNLLDPQAAIDARVAQQESELTRLREENEALKSEIDTFVKKADFPGLLNSFFVRRDVHNFKRDSLRAQLAKAKEAIDILEEICVDWETHNNTEVEWDVYMDIIENRKELHKRARKTLEEITSRQTLSEIDNLNRKST